MRRYFEAVNFLKEAPWRKNEPVLWTGADSLDLPDPQIGQKAQLYNLDAVAYESIMLGIYQIHRGPGNDECKKKGLPKITELNFAYSRDGFHWSRPDRQTAIRAERKDIWDRGYIQPLGNICMVRGDKLWFYYIGFQGRDTRLGNREDIPWNGMYDRGAMGVAFLRRDGFASMNAVGKTGTLTTALIKFTGKYLFVNLDAPEGELKVEICDPAGNAIIPFTYEKCRPASGNKTILQIHWDTGKNLDLLKNRPVRLKFKLSNGKLYSFWVSDKSNGCSNGYIAGGGPGFNGPVDSVGEIAVNAEEKLDIKI